MAMCESTKEAGRALQVLGLKRARFPKAGVGYTLRMEVIHRNVRGQRFTEYDGVEGWLTGDKEAADQMAERVAAAGFDVRCLWFKGKPNSVFLTCKGRPGTVERDSIEAIEQRRAAYWAKAEGTEDVR